MNISRRTQPVSWAAPFVAALVVAASGLPATAQQRTGVDEREADMFGRSDGDSEESSEDGQTQRDTEIFGEQRDDKELGDRAQNPEESAAASPSQTTLLEEQFEQRLETREADVLEIGGGIFSQLQYTVLEEGRPEEFPLSQPNYLDVYIDARPNDRLRVYADGRLSYTPTTTSELNGSLTGAAAEPTDAQLDELWVKFDIARTVYVTAGRQHLRWGVGRFWFPNDFLFEQRRDPLALFDVRTGADLVKLHLPVESLGWNFYAVANLDDAESPDSLGGATRAEFLAGLTEFAVSAAAQKGDPVQLGADISTGIGWFDLRAAATVLHGVERPFFRGSSNFEDFDEITDDNFADIQLPDSYSRSNDWIPRALVGGEVAIPYGDDDTVYIGAEYFFNDAGYSDPELYPWLIFNGAFRPLYNGRHYAALYALFPAPDRWDDTTLSLSTLGNLSDRSFLSRLDYSINVLTHMRAFAFGSITYGSNGEFTQGFRVPAISEDAVAAARASGRFNPPRGFDLSGGFSGLTRPPTRASLGAGLSLNF